jgi:hypothetical protein
LTHVSALKSLNIREKVLHVPAIAADRVTKPVPEAKINVKSGDGFWAHLTAQFVTLCFCLAIGIGFYAKKWEQFVPGEGVGYFLGIAGGTAMLLLLLYPLVKRSTKLGFQKHSVFWLRVHMFLGSAGPVMIFYHSNFSFGATNSNIALISMILVAASGVMGRYIYTRVHRGMSAVKLDLGSLLADSARVMTHVGDQTGGSSAAITIAMSEYAKAALPQSARVLPSVFKAMLLPLRSSFAHGKIMREVRKSLRKNSNSANWSSGEERQRLALARAHVEEFMYLVSKASQLGFWERMFSAWHVLHVPLFFLLLVSGVIHVVAVHLY